MATEDMIAEDILNEMNRMGRAARVASRSMAKASTATKNSALEAIAKKLQEKSLAIQAANEEDIAQALKAGMAPAFVDRLRISDKVLQQMIEGVRQIASLSDPIGEINHIRPQPSGLHIGQMRVPLGVIGMIYESRPNVTVDAAALCIKSGNATILRGGSEAIRSNQVLADLIKEALASVNLPQDAVQVVATTDRAMVSAMITSPQFIDVIVPRGGKSLIARLMKEARVPMIKHLDGICHTYVDGSANLNLAVAVCDNAKTQRYSPCNATETLLVSVQAATSFLPLIAKVYADKAVEMRCDKASKALLEAAGFKGLKDATEEDWSTEYNAPIISIKVVEGLDEAIDHINRYGSHHTDAIITNNALSASRFLREVDSASVMHNTSTRFADGFEYGLGAEIGISNDKLHARGPVGLEGLTSLKYIVLGHGELRK